MTGQRVVVSAGAAGIGRAIVECFREAGARIAVGDIDVSALERLRDEAPEVHVFQVDVAQERECLGFLDQAERTLGGVDVLVNNAGVAGAHASLDKVPAAKWRHTFAVNVDGAFYLTKGVAPLMRRQGGGAVINISTSSVQTSPVGRIDYVASKWALEGLTVAAARELGPDRIRVNAIRPGLVDSDRMRSIIAARAASTHASVTEVEDEFLRFISMRSKVAPDEIGRMAVFLASENARNVTGQLIAVDGGVEWES